MGADHGNTLSRQDYLDWCASTTPELTGDPLWRMAVYRLALFILDCAWHDAVVLDRGVTRPVAAQLYSAVSSIAANIAEGYGRHSSRDRARFYEYALGSAREALVWYRAGKWRLGDDIAGRRIQTLVEIRRLLLHITPAERSSISTAVRNP